MGIHYGKADFINYGKPSLLLDFAREKSLVDRISRNNLITFERNSVGTYVGSDGLIKTASADEARFDHNPETGESLGLLIEESRTNLAPYSQELNAATWNKYFGSSVSANYAIAPDGTQTADRIIFNGDQYGQLALNLANVLTVGEQYIYSVWAKSDGSSTAATLLYVNGYYVSLNVTSEWKRFQVAYTATSTSVALLFLCSSQVNSLLVWGVQFEKGSFPTSYIPTSGSAVTRQPDNARITGTNFSSWYNQPEGSYLFNAQTFKNVSGNIYYGESGNGAANRNIMYANNVNGNAVLYYVENNNIPVTTLSAGYTFAANTFVKTAYCYKQNDFGVFATGGLSNFDTSGNIHTANSFSIGMNNINSGEYLNGHIKQLTYYPTRLTNAQLQALTQ